MIEISARTLTMAIQGIDAAIIRILEPYNGDTSQLDPDDHEVFIAYARAAGELEQAYLKEMQSSSGMIPYEDLVKSDY